MKLKSITQRHVTLNAPNMEAIQFQPGEEKIVQNAKFYSKAISAMVGAGMLKILNDELEEVTPPTLDNPLLIQEDIEEEEEAEQVEEEGEDSSREEDAPAERSPSDMRIGELRELLIQRGVSEKELQGKRKRDMVEMLTNGI